MRKATLVVGVLWLSAIGLAGWTLAQLPLGEMVANLTGLDAVDYLLWGAVNILIIFMLNQRWWLISRALQAPVNFLELLFIKQAGQSISFITPGPQVGGEPLQVFWLWRRAQLPVHKALLSLGLDRFFEFIINFAVLILCVALLLFTSASGSANWGFIFIGLLATAIALLLFARLLIRRPRWLADRLDILAHQWHDQPYLKSAITHWSLLREDLRSCLRQQRKALGYAGLLSVGSWIAMFTELQLLLWMADISLDIAGFLLFFVAMRLALLLPLPGGIGTMEAAIFWSLHYLNIPDASALIVIALIRLRDILILVFGLACAGLFQRPRSETIEAELESTN